MQNHHVEFLIALSQEKTLAGAARRCAVSPGVFRAEIALLEAEYDTSLLSTAFGNAELTPAGKKLLHWAKAFHQECSALSTDMRQARRDAALAPLLTRRSISPKRLRLPAPTADEIDLMIQAAMRGPDHGAVRPWRVIGFAAAQRFALAELFEAEKRRRDPLASGADLLRAKDHATRPPALLAFVVSPDMRHPTPVREQWLAAGAALGNFLTAAHQLGYGAIVLSGERCFDADLTAALGVGTHEFLAGFISLGTISQAPPARPAADPATMRSQWAFRAADVNGGRERGKAPSGRTVPGHPRGA